MQPNRLLDTRDKRARHGEPELREAQTLANSVIVGVVSGETQAELACRASRPVPLLCDF